MKAPPADRNNKFDAAQKEGLKFFDPAIALNNYDKWLQAFDEVFLKRTK
jgi:hypothetical protein